MSKFNPQGKREQGSQPKLEFSNQSLTYPVKFDMGLGRLVPFLCQPVMPNQYVEGNPEFLLRTNPFVAQVYQRYNVDISYFFVPMSQLWNHFYLMLSGGFSGTDEYVHPYMDWMELHPHLLHVGSIFDYMDVCLPDLHLTNDHTAQVDTNDPRLTVDKMNVLPIMAYAKVFFDHFASSHFDYGEFIQEMIEMKNIDSFAVDGNNNRHLFALFNRMNLGADTNTYDSFLNQTNSTVFQCPYGHYDWDYFTSAMPEQQHGPLLSIPLDADGSVNFTNFLDSNQQPVDIQDSNFNRFRLNAPDGAGFFGRVKDGVLELGINNSSFNTFGEMYDYSSDQRANLYATLKVDVKDNRALINDLRSVMILTEFFESLGNVSWRPEDFTLSQFNQRSKDLTEYKSQRLKYQRFYVNIGEVFSNNVSTDVEGSSQSVAGVGTSTAKGYGIGESFKFKAEEFGYVMGIVHVSPEAAYSQGIPRHYRMLDRFDYPNPKFAHLGYQDIRNDELAYNGRKSGADPFGYQPRYSEWRTNVPRVRGNFRFKTNVNCASRQFTDLMPLLGEHFLQTNPSYNNSLRTFNTIWNHQAILPIQIDMVNHLHAYEPLPKVGLPRI